MIIDFDDFHEGHDRMDLLERLHDENPAFKATVFAPPALGSDDFWTTVPDWLELAVHGWDHGGFGCPDAHEASRWSYPQALEALLSAPVCFSDGFKAPGWQISGETYMALDALDWWVADQPYNDERRPRGLRTHRLGDGDHHHFHIQNVCGNGIEERFPELLALVAETEHFAFVSEAAHRWAVSEVLA